MSIDWNAVGGVTQFVLGIASTRDATAMAQIASYGFGPLATAIRQKDAKEIEEWANKEDERGNTPIVVMASLGHAEAVNKLLEYPNVKLTTCSSGWTAQAVAWARGHYLIADEIRKKEESR